MGAGICYALAARETGMLLGVVACLAVNWLGDSVDGTLARMRNRQRPRYGCYVDHMLDTFSGFFLMGGLALSGYAHPGIAMGMLVGFLMLSVEAYLASYTLRRFRLSYAKVGPTELRILLALGSVALLFRPVIHIWGRPYLLFDVGGVIAMAGIAGMLVVSAICLPRVSPRWEKAGNVPSVPGFPPGFSRTSPGGSGRAGLWPGWHASIWRTA